MHSFADIASARLHSLRDAMLTLCAAAAPLRSPRRYVGTLYLTSAHVCSRTSSRSGKGKEERHPAAGDKGKGLAAVIGNYRLSPVPPGAATSAKL